VLNVSDVNLSTVHSITRFDCMFCYKLYESLFCGRLKDRDNALARQRELEREVELLKERLDASQAGWMAARSNLEDRERQAAECDAQQLQAFQRTVAEMLSDSCIIVSANEKDITQRLHQLICASRDKTAVRFSNDFDFFLNSSV